MTDFIKLLGQRRSIYDLNQNLPINKDQVEDLVKQAVKLSPSAFNSQSSRVIFLWDQAKDQFWDEVEKLLKSITSAENFVKTKEKLTGFKSGAGVALFFEDLDVVANLQQKFALYADNFPKWSEQSTGIAAINAWSALTEVGIGANLQHYNPLIDQKVQELWQTPENWELKAQLVFGGINSQPQDKEFIDDQLRFKSFE